MTKSNKINFLINVLFYAVCAVIIYFVFRFLLVYLFPFLIGLFITIAVQKPATIISNKIKIKKGYCALFLVILFYILITSFIVLGFYFTGKYFSGFISNKSGVIEQFADFLNYYSTRLVSLFEKLPPDITNKIADIFNGLVDTVTSYVSNFATRMAKSTPMFFTSAVVTIIASCYIAKDFEKFKDSVFSVLPIRFKLALNEFKILLKEKILKIVVGYAKILGITFLELLVGFLLFKVPNSFLIAILVSLLDLLPIFGTGTVLIPWSIVSFLSSDYYLGIGLLVIYAIILIVRNIVEPKIIGKQIGLHPLIALVSVFIGLKIVGVFGIFLAPLTVILVYSMFERGIFQILFSKNE